MDPVHVAAVMRQIPRTREWVNGRRPPPMPGEGRTPIRNRAELAAWLAANPDVPPEP